MTPAAKSVLALLTDGKARTRTEVRETTRLADKATSSALLSLRRDNFIISFPQPPSRADSVGRYDHGQGLLWKLNPNP